MKTKRKNMWNKILVFCLTVTMTIIMFAGTMEAKADEFVKEISTFTDLMYWIQMSKTDSFVEPQKYTFKLMNDIEITESDLNDLKNGVYDVPSYGKVRSVTFGHQNKKFGGIFDGQGYSIKGLTYNAEELEYAADTGLFSYTDGATIKNLVVENANIDADYRGGFIVGSADNTTFENITVLDSNMRVSCSNNVLTLVTDGGLVGGAIAGEAVNCVFYNCESNNTTINNNNTAGVSALGGKGLYLGGLVGTADKGTLIEYSRVIGGQVKSHYDVAVGALGGNTIYVGGIVGQMQSGSKVLDCFATPYLYTYCATYVSVGGGNSGHIGGIAAATYGSSCEVERCHFAGTMESQQYNAVLVIPIIQNNVNLYGLVDKIPDELTVKESYFRKSTAGDVEPFGDNNMSSDSSGYGPKDDTTYIDTNFWESKGYDFVGNIVRDTKYTTTEYTDGANHTNKWIMDYEQGIPVHGIAASATFDFPGAGSVTIGPSTLINAAVTTDDTYHFAVQGVNPRNPLDTNRTLKLSVTLNEGYHFYGWYKESDYMSNYVTDISELERIAHDSTKLVSEEMTANVYMEDNDLYVACMKAEVKFHELSGSEIESATKGYTYEEALDDVRPNTIPEGAVFYGWTDIPSNEAGGGYSAITSIKLIELQQKNAIYFAGDPVTKAMKLYPIFTNYITNIHTIFEGNEQDSNPNITLREGVGYTTVGSDDTGVYIKALAEDGTTTFPDGYRFLGWYQTLEDGTEVLVSTDETYYVPDLTKEVTYTARFEYRVDYYTTNKEEIEEVLPNNANLFTSIWHKYEEGFHDIRDAHLDGLDTFMHWALSSNDNCESSSCSDMVTSSKQIVEPLKVYAHVNGSTGFDVLITSDFPDSGTLSSGGEPASAIKNNQFWVNVDVNEDINNLGYNFLLWSRDRNESSSGFRETGDEEKWTEQYFTNTSRKFAYVAHLTADVVFRSKTGNDMWATRRYNENVFFYEDQTYTYTYYFSGASTGRTNISAKAPTDEEMKIDGYAFLGWIDATELAADEIAYIYDIADDSYCTSDVTKALPYMMQESEVCTKPMDIYPVYAKYNVQTTTNIDATTVPEGVNKPSLPTYLPNPVTTYDVKEGLATITLTAEHNQTVVINGQEETYQLIGFTCEVDGKATDIFATGTQNADGSYSFNYEIQAGKSYLFTAIYNPVVVVYHLDNNETKMYVKNNGDQLGYQPEPDYADISGIENAIFVGWTDVAPSGNKQWIMASNDLPILTWTTIVHGSMDLYPVFITGGITVNSNIDDILDNDEDVRYVQKTDNEFSLVAEEHPGYVFKGWYTGYGTNNQTQITEENIYPLSQKEFLSNTTYTAVYEESFQVRYHDLSGNVIYTANVLDSDQRTFVQNVEVSVENEDGTVSTETKEVPIDIEAFTAIEETLQSTQTFMEWQWWNEETSTYVAWDEFKNVSITKDMDIYPVVYRVSFSDAAGSGYTEKMTYVISEVNGVQKLDALFAEDYQQEYLDILVEEQRFDKATEAMTTTGKSDIHTNVFVEVQNKDGQTEYVVASDGTEITDDEGKARHYFYAHLTIQKSYTKTTGDISEKQSVEEFVVITLKNSNTKEVISVPVTVVDGSGEIHLKLPAGTYLIEEEKEWIWRDTYKTTEGLETGDSIELKILDYKTVTFTNERTNSRWFSDSVRKENVFKQVISTTGGE